MKKTILIISLLIFSNVTWAQKAPEGFWGLKWGSGKEELKKLLDPIIARRPEILTDLSRGRLGSITERFDDFYQSDSINFRAEVKKEWEKIGEGEVTHYFFYYHENKFYKASVSFPKHLSFDIFLKALTMKYGNPQSVTPLGLKINPNAKAGMDYGWTLECKVRISLRYNDMESREVNGNLKYIYPPVWLKIEGMRDKDAA
jgi:hypothetical protein